jgi:carbon-monoxide dehydrogenase medium subunit
MGERLIQLARAWVVDKYPYNSTHLLKSLDWLDRLEPGAGEAVRLATLTHDMERAFGGPDAIPIKMSDRSYEEAHSNRSARIVGEWLRANGAPAELVADVEALIRVHEWGGSPDANLVQAADSLSFLETNIDLMIGFVKTGKYSGADIAFKFDQMYERIQVPVARELARPMWEAAKARLEASSPLYLRPESLAELLALMGEHGSGARLLAGGTDLVVRVKKRRDWPFAIIDLKRVREFRADVTEANGRIRIGARAVMTDIVDNTGIRDHFPALLEAALTVGSVQIRNRATLAGNICNASPAADTAPALLAYRATVNVVGAHGRREIPSDNFFAGPGRTTLAAGEIVESIDLPRAAERSGSAFVRLTRRHGVDLAIVSVCCAVGESGNARFAFGAAGPRPFAVDTRRDAPLDDVLKLARPISDLRASERYRAAMLPVLARRALKTAESRLNESRGT